MCLCMIQRKILTVGIRVAFVNEEANQLEKELAQLSKVSTRGRHTSSTPASSHRVPPGDIGLSPSRVRVASY